MMLTKLFVVNRKGFNDIPLKEIGIVSNYDEIVTIVFAQGAFRYPKSDFINLILDKVLMIKDIDTKVKPLQGKGRPFIRGRADANYSSVARQERGDFNPSSLRETLESVRDVTGSLNAPFYYDGLLFEKEVSDDVVD